MSKTIFKKSIAIVLTVAMLISALPLTLLASDPAVVSDGFVSETHDVFSSTTSTIAPGVTQKINYAYAKDGKQMVYYVATADINRDDVLVQTSYFNQFENGAFGMAKVTDQLAYADKLFTDETKDSFISEHYKTVVGVNGDFYNMSTGRPTGAFVINGVMSSTKANNRPWFAIFEDGTATCGYNNTDWDAAVTAHGAVQQAVGGSQMLVVDGADVTATATGDYNLDRHSRTCVGVTADGKVVMMVLDGRQEPFSCGGSMHELAQIMLEAGCVTAINLDGGGSTTYVSRPEGKNDVEVVNRPSDGSERAVSSGLIIASLAAPSDVFDRAILTAENTYVTPYSVVNVSAAGVSPAGTAAEIPENAVWQLKDSSFGTVENGVFTSNGKTGTVVVQLLVDGIVVGETTVNVVIPEISFSSSAMTVPYNKTFKLSVTGTTNNGLNKVTLKDSDIVFELSDSKMGTINGSSYTTCGEETGITGGTITAKCVYDESKTSVATVTFGKASVIVEDFEDGSDAGWSVKSGYARSGKGDLTYGRMESFDLGIVDSTTGKVRNGNYAMELVADWSTCTAAGYKSIKYSFPAIDTKGATTVGMWLYLPVEDVHYLEFDIGGYEYYIEDDADITEEGWYYITAPAATVGSSLSTFTIYNTDPDATYFNVFNTYSIYVDDITLDYSNATEDREIPKFSKVNVVTGLDSESAVNGQTVAENTVTIKAYAVENLTGNYTGLDLNSAKVYVDGKALDSSAYFCDEKGIITVGDLYLSNGTHTLRFEINDLAGNTGFVTRQISVNAKEGDVYLAYSPSEGTPVQPLANSVIYFDLIAKNVENVDEITLSVELDTLNKWEFEGADVAYGFDLDYTISDDVNTANIKVTKTGDVELTGEAVIAKIPVRIWGTKSYLMQKFIDAGLVSNSTGANESTTVATPYVMWQTDRTRLVRVELEVVAGSVSYADGSTDTFASEQKNIITEHNRYRVEGYYTNDGQYVKGDTTFCKQGKESMHVHSDAVAIADKAATCTEAGYTGRTICEDCGSVVDWGTKVPATGHSYKEVDGVLKCECGKLYNGESEGKFYVDGVVASGWVNDSYYVDGVKLTGIQIVDEYYYNFGEDGISKGKFTGLFYDEEAGAYRYSKIGVLAKGWVDVEGSWYYFDKEFNGANGELTGKATSSTESQNFKYSFVDGKLQSGVWVDTGSGIRYYYGPSYYKATNVSTVQWFYVDGVKYAADPNGYRYEGLCALLEANEKIPTAYVFAEDGAFIEVFTGTGLAKNYAGRLFYFVDGAVNHAGLVEVDGDYYYIDSSYRAVTGSKYIGAAWTNGIFPAGTYEFGSDGKMLNPPVATPVPTAKPTEAPVVTSEPTEAPVVTPAPTEKPDVKNGIVNENGKLFYYVDGVRNHAGLILIDGDYYYVDSSCRVITNVTRYVVAAWTNGLMPAGNYTFDADGKMVNPPVATPVPTDAPVVTPVPTAEPTEAPVVTPAPTAKPDVKNGIVNENGKLFYYVDGVRNHAGLILIDGDYYYVDSSCRVITNVTRYVVAAWTNGLMPAGNYTFGADGKMVNPPVATPVPTDAPVVTPAPTEAPEVTPAPTEKPEVKNGIVNENGKLFYYVDGVRNHAGLICIDGDYYYVDSSCRVITNVTRYVVAAWTNGLMPAGTYTFGADGKMVI